MKALVAVVAVGAAALWLAPWPWSLGLAAVLCLGLLAWASIDVQGGWFCRTLWRGDRAHPRAALTYDDGPDPSSTPLLLDLLRERGVRAAFFVVGERALQHPELVRRIRAEGHLLGNHSQRHSPLINLYSRARLAAELGACQDAIAAAAGERPTWYRPPFGLTNHATGSAARRHGLAVVGWSIRSFDTLPFSVPRVIARVAARLHPGAIVLLHDGGRERERVLAVTRGVLDALAVRGLETVRLDALLQQGAKP